MTTKIDLTGKRFGKLIVIEYVFDENSQRNKWLCRCDCGKEKLVMSAELKNGDTSSCGNHRFIDETGKKYGRLLVIKKGENIFSGNGSSATWICKCDCGRTKIVVGRELRNGNARSCGVCERLPRGESSFNSFYSHCVKNAIERGYEWALSREQVRKISSSKCFYCGRQPFQVSKTSNNTGEYVHVGIDRIDNKTGYIIENVVPCCKTCNYAKRKMSIAEFREWIACVYKHSISIE